MIKKDYHIQSPNYVDDNEFGRKKKLLALFGSGAFVLINLIVVDSRKGEWAWV